jgi:hypothetical protein
MKIALLQTGKTSDINISALADLYTARIKKYSVFEIISLSFPAQTAGGEFW